MREHIIYSSLNEAELFRTLARYDKNLFGYWAMNTNELIEYVLNKEGKTMPSLLKNDEIINLIYNTKQDDKSINELGNINYNIASNIYDTINNIRELHVDPSEFTTDKESFYSIYQKVDNHINKFNLYDKNRLIRFALQSLTHKLDVEVIVLNNEKHSFIEEYFLSKVFSNVTYKSISDFIETSPKREIKSFTKAISKRAEILDALNILKQEELDKSVFVLADSSYVDECESIFKSLNIKYTNTFGTSIKESNALKVLKAYRDWNYVNFNNIDSLSWMVNSNSFNKELFIGNYEKDLDFIIKELGNLKISNNKQENEEKVKNYIELVSDENYFNEQFKGQFGLKEINDSKTYIEVFKDLVEKLELDEFEFIRTFTKYVDVIFEEKVLSEIKKVYKLINDYALDEIDVNDLINDLYNKRVSKTVSAPGSIHITDIKNAFQSIRKNIFIMGLSSEILPKDYTQNSIFLDNDYKKIDVDVKYLPIKENTIDNEIDRFKKLIYVAFDLNSDIYLSYSEKDIASVKSVNPSSVMFDIYKELGGISFKDYLDKYRKINDYFDSELLYQDKYGKKYNDSVLYKSKNHVETPTTKINTKLLNDYKIYSPSNIHTFFECPFKFFLQNVFGIYIDDEDDPFDLIKVNDFGTLVHLCLELLFDKDTKSPTKISETDFINTSLKYFNFYFIRRVPMNKYDIMDGSKEKEYFKKVIMNGYNRLISKNIKYVEEPIYTKFTNGVNTITIGGRPDCIYEEDGEYVIVDYKTSVKIKHVEGDTFSCMQALYYAYCFEKTYNLKVKRIEYHYLKLNSVISCEYNSGVESQIECYLNTFLSCIEKNLFPSNLKKGKVKESGIPYIFDSECNYCKVKDICDTKEKAKEEGDGD